MYALYTFKLNELKNKWECIDSPIGKDDTFPEVELAEDYAANGGNVEMILDEGPGTYRIDVREVWLERDENGSEIEYVTTLSEFTFKAQLSLVRYAPSLDEQLR